MKHTVIFKLIGSTEERRALAGRFAEALMELPAIIPQLSSMQTGLNVNPKEDYDVILTAEADTLDDIAAYSSHPAHLACVEIIKGHIASRACVDWQP